jgi:hypothetical protein
MIEIIEKDGEWWISRGTIVPGRQGHGRGHQAGRGYTTNHFYLTQRGVWTHDINLADGFGSKDEADDFISRIETRLTRLR